MWLQTHPYVPKSRKTSRVNVGKSRTRPRTISATCSYSSTNKCIHSFVSMKSPEIGHVEPKSAQQCASLISKSQRTMIKPCTLEIVLVEITKKSENGSLTQGDKKSTKKRRGRKTANEQYEFNRLKRNALLDFFSDETKTPLLSFSQARNLPENIRRQLNLTGDSFTPIGSADL